MNTALYHAVIDAEYSVADAHRRIADITYSLDKAHDERISWVANLEKLHLEKLAREKDIKRYQQTIKDSRNSRPFYRRFFLTRWEKLHRREIGWIKTLSSSHEEKIANAAAMIDRCNRDEQRLKNILKAWQEKLRVSELDAHGYRTGYLEPAFAY